MFISYRISLLFERILQFLNSFLFNRFFLNNPLTPSQGMQNLTQHVHLFFTSIFVVEFVRYVDELLTKAKNY